MEQTTRARRRGGFTLVELIVVLIILGILAALLLPTLTGYLQKARQTRAIAECRACVQAVISLAGQDYADRTFEPDGWLDKNKDAVKELAETPAGGDITSLNFGTTTSIESLLYTSPEGLRVMYKNKTFTVMTDTVTKLTYEDIQEMSTINKIHDGKALMLAAVENKKIDSETCATYNGTSYYPKLNTDNSGKPILYANTTSNAGIDPTNSKSYTWAMRAKANFIYVPEEDMWYQCTVKGGQQIWGNKDYYADKLAATIAANPDLWEPAPDFDLSI